MAGINAPSAGPAELSKLRSGFRVGTVHSGRSKPEGSPPYIVYVKPSQPKTSQGREPRNGSLATGHWPINEGIPARS
jgi:hypothetical protein